jgi:hypothetical protein
MLSQDCVREMRSCWLPNITNSGLARLVDLLEKNSPLLIHGSFTRAVPMGCLATHAAWHHPETSHLTLDAGIQWLNRVAGLNPATSNVIREWDTPGDRNSEMRRELLMLLKQELKNRHEPERTAAREEMPVEV